MKRVLARLHRGQDGIAMVTALLVTTVVLMLSIAVLGQAMHNVTQAGYDRRRLNSVNAAESGIDWFFHHLENNGPTQLVLSPYTGTTGAAPGTVTFTVTPTYYADTDGTVPFSGTPTNEHLPKSVKIVSDGIAADGTTRRMESFAILTPTYGGLQGAVIANSNTTARNNVNLDQYNGTDADVVIMNGNFSLPAGTTEIKGSLYVANGSVDLSTGVHVYGDVWAKGDVRINSPSVLIDGDVKSSSGAINAIRGLVHGKAYYCTGSAPSSSVFPGAKIQTCALGDPPSLGGFPQIKFNRTAWESLGYEVKEFSGATACTSARDWIEGTTSGTYNKGAGVQAGRTGVVVRILSTCAYSPSNLSSNPVNAISLGTDLAIITNGGIAFSQQSNWKGTGEVRSLHLISAWPDTGTPVCPTQNITIKNNNNFDPATLEVSIYSPCTVSLENNNASFNGQVIGTTVDVTNRFSMSYRPVLIPGARVSGFRQDVAYLREVSARDAG